jgi:hypothetical protein
MRGRAFDGPEPHRVKIFDTSSRRPENPYLLEGTDG